jgi:capsule polysaccharide export protein KpsE/RkpR
MNTTAAALQSLFNRIPRRHSLENVKEIYSIFDEYENLLISIEGTNAFYEKNIPVYFDELEDVRALIKKSTDNKASKKMKDSLFDEGSGNLKDGMQKLMEIYGDGSRTA